MQLDYANALIDGSSDLSKTLPPHFAETVTRIRTLAPDNPLGLYYGGLVARAQGGRTSEGNVAEGAGAHSRRLARERQQLQREIETLGKPAN